MRASERYGASNVSVSRVREVRVHEDGMSESVVLCSSEVKSSKFICALLSGIEKRETYSDDTSG